MNKSIGNFIGWNFFVMLITIAIDSHATADAISAASLQLTTTRSASTTVTFDFSFTHRDGTRKLCYAPSPQAPSTTCVTDTPNAKTGQISITGLQPATTYSYTFSAIDTRGKHRSSTIQGNFATAKSDATSVRTGIQSQARLAKNENQLDAMGRRNLPIATSHAQKQFHTALKPSVIPE